MNGLILMLLLTNSSGRGIGPGLINAIIAQRKQRWERIKTMIDFTQGVLTNGYFMWRGVQVVKNADGTPAVSNEAIMAKLDANQKDSLQQWFFNSVMGKGVPLVLDLLKPSEIEEQIMMALLTNPSATSSPALAPPAPPPQALPSAPPATQNVVVQTPPSQNARPTARQVRMNGGRAQGVILTDQGIFDI